MSDKQDGAARRAMRFAAMSAGVTGSYLGYLAQSMFLDEQSRDRKLRATHTKAARRMTDEFLELRGPAMKLGQMLSLQQGALPPEMLEQLSTLQMQAPGMHAPLVRAQFKGSIGKNPEDVFRKFDPVPFAAASLGQVPHVTMRNGEPGAVKIQYPGIQHAIDSDFKWFRTVSKPAQLSQLLPNSALDELQEQIRAECDYKREADNIDFYASHLKALPYIELPRVHRALSSDRVLTMSVVRGKHLDDFLATKPSQKLRNLVGERLFEFFYYQLLVMQSLHADPHWGNYLFNDNGTIGVVDFGCVKYFDRAFMDNLRRLFLYGGDRNSEEFTSILAERYAGRGMKLTRPVHRALADMSLNFYGKVYPPDVERDHEPFDFSDEEVLKEYMRCATQLARAKGTLPEYVMLGRAETGLYQTLHRLRAQVHTSAIVRKYLGHTYP